MLLLVQLKMVDSIFLAAMVMNSTVAEFFNYYLN